MTSHTETQKNHELGPDITQYSEAFKAKLKYTIQIAIKESSTISTQVLKVSRLFSLIEIFPLPLDPIEEINTWNGFILEKKGEIIKVRYGNITIDEAKLSRFLSYLNALYISLSTEHTNSDNTVVVTNGIKEAISKTI